jgi:hypothetical protein
MFGLLNQDLVDLRVLLSEYRRFRVCSLMVILERGESQVEETNKMTFSWVRDGAIGIQRG